MSKNRILSLVLALVMVLGAFGTVFADTVSPAKTQEEAAAFLKGEGVLEGNAAGDLMLDKELRRRDSVILYSKLLKEFDTAKEFAGEPTFTDIKKEDGSFKDPAYVPFLKWAQENEHYVGKVNGEFGWDANLTAQEYSVVLLKSLGYTVGTEEKVDVKWEDATKKAAELGVFKGFEKVEEAKEILRGEMALMTFNALGIKIKGTEQTLAAKLGIELPEADKPAKLTAEVKDTENLVEVVVELSNADLVKNKEALTNPNNYRFNDANIKVYNAKLDGDNVVLTLVPYGKLDSKTPVAKELTKGKKYTLTIRNVDSAINKEYKDILAQDNTVPSVEKVEYIGTHGIKVTTNEPVAKLQERNFRLDDKRSSLIIEQYGREIILTPYNGKAFDAKELVIEELVDFAGYKSAKVVETIETAEVAEAPKVVEAYRAGEKLTLIFDQDVYHDSISANESRRELGNVSFAERRTTDYAKEATKVDTNKVEYIFEREIPKNMDILVEGVKNHDEKTMEKQTVTPKVSTDDNAPVVISKLDIKVATKGTEKAGETLAGKTETFTIKFDKDIQELKDYKASNFKAEDFFDVYSLEVANRNRITQDVVFTVGEVKSDSIEIQLSNAAGKSELKVNNSRRDYDYVLEVKDFHDLNRNRMDREYIDFQITTKTSDFAVELDTIQNVRNVNRDTLEFVLKFNKKVDVASAEDANNYSVDGKLVFDEARVERDGKTVTLVINDTTYAKFFEKTRTILEVSPRVKDESKDNSVETGQLKLNVDATAVTAVETEIAKIDLAKLVDSTNSDYAANKAATEESRVLYNGLTTREKEQVKAADLAKLEKAEKMLVIQDEIVKLEKEVEDLEAKRDEKDSEGKDVLSEVEKAQINVEIAKLEGEVNVKKAELAKLAE